MTQFWVGGYGPGMDGDATGIGLLEGDEGREPLTLAYRGAVTSTASPSWLAQHPSLEVIYAALEGAGTVQAFRRTEERALSPIGRPVEVGQSVCHLAVAPTGAYLIASCYGDGRVVHIGLDAAGAMLVPKIADAASDPYGIGSPEEPELFAGAVSLREADALFGQFEKDAAAEASAASEMLAAAMASAGFELPSAATERDAVPEAAELVAEDPATRASHAHAAAFLPDGRIATTDLGFDLVRIWRPGPSGLIADHTIALPYGVGPRHMVVHPSGHLHVVTEYSCEVFTLAAAASGKWQIVAVTLATPAAQIGFDFAAELARSRDGATLYTALRGSNTIAALRVRGAGETVEPIALADSGVDWPRHHLIHDGTLLVAGQRSDQISVIDLDERTGTPRGIRHRAAAPAPTHLLLAR
ncbi:3-carboxymuconate cyclase [Microbacterium sp. CH12i]|uniref:lactonase family protein n=1 Tax=Microbacterium sp. CH12i TaxID=1479651 RepID=UPI000461CC61|nr:beta-propeller fold lactonase family protein [Microbacterium sp. CH12i]KDA05192.1 3-carboxymuconate cyclase [Microbacterium sp. CH12i]